MAVYINIGASKLYLHDFAKELGLDAKYQQALIAGTQGKAVSLLQEEAHKALIKLAEGKTLNGFLSGRVLMVD